MKVKTGSSRKNIRLLQIILFLISSFATYFTGDLFALLMFVVFILIFYSLTYMSVKIIKSGNVKLIKDLSNTIWNISTAASFSYAVYLLLRYKIKNITIDDASINYINLHPHLSYSILIFLILTAILRASVSIAELVTTDYSKR